MFLFDKDADLSWRMWGAKYALWALIGAGVMAFLAFGPITIPVLAGLAAITVVVVGMVTGLGVGAGIGAIAGGVAKWRAARAEPAPRNPAIDPLYKIDDSAPLPERQPSPKTDIIESLYGHTSDDLGEIYDDEGMHPDLKLFGLLSEAELAKQAASHSDRASGDAAIKSLNSNYQEVMMALGPRLNDGNMGAINDSLGSIDDDDIEGAAKRLVESVKAGDTVSAPEDRASIEKQNRVYKVAIRAVMAKVMPDSAVDPDDIVKHLDRPEVKQQVMAMIPSDDAGGERPMF